MKTVRSALLTAAVLASVPSMAFAQPDGQFDNGERGGRPTGPGRFERRPDAQPPVQNEQPRPQEQRQEQRQEHRQDFGGRQDFRGRSDQGQAPAPVPAQFDGQRPQGQGRFAQRDNQPGGFDRRPQVDNRQLDNRQFDNRQFNGRPSDNRAPGLDRRFDNNNQYRGGDNRFDNNQYRGGDRRFDNDNRFSGNNRFQPDWRGDRRYDWRGYRNNNRQLFRAPRYSPPRGYGYGFGYRPLVRGYQLQPFFYGQNYWINDPWQYRLPPVDGTYRWVRYYNDVLLVDIYSGNVVDVIQNFFW